MSTKIAENLARQLYLTGAARFGGPFTLSSGATSDYYVDVRHFVSNHANLRAVAKMLGCFPTKALCFAGVALGGVSLAAAFALHWHTSFLVVRPEAKAHGMKNQIEGKMPLPGSPVVLIEDVATSGWSIMRAARVLREAGLTVDEARVVVDREQGAEHALKAEGIALRSLVTGSVIRAVGERLALEKH